jgi:hypothetical protein
MNKTKIIELILKKPNLTNKEVASMRNTTAATVGVIRSELRKKGKLPKFDPAQRRKVKTLKMKAATYEALAPVEEIKSKLKDLIKTKKPYTLEALSDYFNSGIGNVRKAVEELAKEGFNIKLKDSQVYLSSIIEQSPNTTLDISRMSTGFYKFGAIGDNHLCSKYERLDVLNAIYDLYEKEGIKVVYNTGNWIDGEARFNVHDLHVHGMDNQIDYFLQQYPKRKGITTYFVAGDDHEGWYTQREGVDIGKYVSMKAQAAGRTDLVYIGHMEADIIIKAKKGQTIIRVLHPGGGSAYATSYTVQKIVESYQGGEKPHVVLAGHYHKAEYLYYRGVHCVQTGCTEDQTPFMRKKKLAAHLGGWIIEMATDDNGAITRFKQEFMPFYDNGYYKQWAYKWKK